MREKGKGMRIMRKKYVAPVITVEHYELTQTIANCKTKIGFGDAKCVWQDSDSTPELKTVAQMYFTNSSLCIDVPTTGQEIADGICYHTNANSAFTS